MTNGDNESNAGEGAVFARSELPNSFRRGMEQALKVVKENSLPKRN